jgi:cellobiose-specific phosphotransferase system component IIA
MAATTMTIAAITAVAATAAGAVVEGIQVNQQGKFAEAEAKINRAQALQSQKQAYQEESLNVTQRYRAGRHDLATGANMMSASGNIGTSAQSALYEGAFNLSEDLSALKYKYDAEAAKYGTQANMYKQHAKMADYNRRMGILASSIKGVGNTSMAVLAAGKTMGWGAGAGGASTPRTTYTGAVDNSGMYGAWGG